MASLDTTAMMSYTEVTKRVTASGGALRIAEVLSKDNPMLGHAPAKQANEGLTNKSARRLSNPTPTWRKVNSGVGVTTSRVVNVWDSIGNLEDYSEMDVLSLVGIENPRIYRTDEAMAHIVGMKDELMSTLLYGNTATAPEEMNGFFTRMPSLAATANVIGCGGTGSDLTSVLIVMWGLDTVFMVYPKNNLKGGGQTYAGIKHTDHGEVTISTATTARANTAQHQALRDHFQVQAGLVVKDNRCTARLCNIETAYNATSNIFHEDWLITLLNRMPNGPKHIYVPEVVATQMQIASKDKSNVVYTPASGDELSGYAITRFNTHPVYKADHILITEDALT